MISSRIQDPTHLAHCLEITFKDVFFDDLSNPLSYGTFQFVHDLKTNNLYRIESLFVKNHRLHQISLATSSPPPPTIEKSLRNPTPSCSVQSRPQCLQLSFCNRMAILKKVSQKNVGWFFGGVSCLVFLCFGWWECWKGFWGWNLKSVSMCLVKFWLVVC